MCVDPDLGRALRCRTTPEVGYRLRALRHRWLGGLALHHAKRELDGRSWYVSISSDRHADGCAGEAADGE